MNTRYPFLAVSLAVLFLTGTGCKKPKLETLPVPLAPAALSPDTALRVHWLGKKQLGTLADAYYVMRLWQLPETRQVEVQVLQKLAVAPWRLSFGEAAVSNAPAAVFGPLLEDVVQEECYLELRQPAHQPEQFVFAIRLNEARAGLWRTNLVAVIASLTGIQTMDILEGGRGWRLKRPQAPNCFELARVDGWTVLSLAQDTNNLIAEVSNLISQPRASGAKDATPWLQADVDFLRLKGVLPAEFKQRTDLPKLSLAVSGDGGNVLTHANLSFAEALQISEEPWIIPTNLIHEPLNSFTVARGLQGPLAALNFWRDQQLFTPPDQICLWAWGTNAFQTYGVMAMPNASNEVARLADRLLEKANPWLAAHDYVSFERLPNGNGVAWGNIPTVRPFFKAVETDASTSLILAGLVPEPPGTSQQPIRPELLASVFGRTNLVAYDWERTGSRVEAASRIAQVAQLVLRRAQLPPDAVALNWLQAISARLSDSETLVTRTGPNQLLFERKSTVGFTGIELSLLADWLESPPFPLGLHSSLKAAGQ